MTQLRKEPPKIAILGWGSLIWDRRPEFDGQHGPWQEDGPLLKLEFSRISETRKGALTLVIDPDYGQECTAQYAISTRKGPADAIADLRCREGTIMKRMGYWFADGSHSCQPPVPATIPEWAQDRGIDAVVWTGLPRNFEKKAQPGREAVFSVEAATGYLQNLPAEGKALAAQYIWRAPEFVQTRLRTALAAEPWFPPPAE
ncbi:hypothetical protein NKH69_30285 [Mesorhizobium sp. M0976]|uniref:hypothetical protein n=1 Tax=Mesorhizobium sp. M0976 TaxID=2957038 RepID=UPI003335AA61